MSPEVQGKRTPQLFSRERRRERLSAFLDSVSRSAQPGSVASSLKTAAVAKSATTTTRNDEPRRGR
jgi:hypothetical protein